MMPSIATNSWFVLFDFLLFVLVIGTQRKTREEDVIRKDDLIGGLSNQKHEIWEERERYNKASIWLEHAGRVVREIQQENISNNMFAIKAYDSNPTVSSSGSDNADIDKLRREGIQPGTRDTPALSAEQLAIRTTSWLFGGFYAKGYESQQLESTPFVKDPGADDNMEILRANIGKFVWEANRIKTFTRDTLPPPSMIDKSFAQMESELQTKRAELDEIRVQDNLGVKVSNSLGKALLKPLNAGMKHMTDDRQVRNTRYKQAGEWLKQLPLVVDWLMQEKTAKETIDRLQKERDSKLPTEQKGDVIATPDVAPTKKEQPEAFTPTKAQTLEIQSAFSSIAGDTKDGIPMASTLWGKIVKDEAEKLTKETFVEAMPYDQFSPDGPMTKEMYQGFVDKLFEDATSGLDFVEFAKRYIRLHAWHLQILEEE